MGSLSSESDSDGEYSEWTTELQTNRLLIMQNVAYERMAPALQSAHIFDIEDDEIVKNPFHNPTSNNKANAMVDCLLRKGRENYEKFLEILGSYYPHVFSKITGKHPPTPPPSPPPAPQYHHQMDDAVLSFFISKLQEKKEECADLKHKCESMRQQLKSNKIEIEKQNDAIKEYARRQEHLEKLESDLAEQQRVTDEIKAENYNLCTRLLTMNDEKSKLKEQNMVLRLDNDKQETELRTLKNRVSSERSQSFRLRRQLDTGPSQREVNALRNEIEDLKMKIAQTRENETFHQTDPDTRVEILRADLNAVTEVYETSSKKVSELREKVDEVEALKDKYFEETERLQLHCSALTDDCQMYKTRRDDLWEQLQEVEAERDRVTKLVLTIIVCSSLLLHQLV